MSEEKPMSNMAKRIIDTTVSKADLYPPGVARCFGNIEAIIDRGFRDELPAEEVVEEIEKKLGDIINILAYPTIKKEIDRQKNG